MDPITANIIFGVVRAVVPALVAWGAAKGWVAPGDNVADGLVSIITALGASIWSVKSNLPPTKTPPRAN